MSKTADSDALRAAPLRAADDRAALLTLCGDNADAVRQHFASWLRVPEPLKERPDLLKVYVRGLSAIAEVFADVLGDASLSQLMTRPAEDNPTVRWDEALRLAREEMNVFRHADAAQRLTELSGHLWRRPDAAGYLPVVLATLAESLFQSGQHDKALETARQALNRFRAAGSEEGIEDYLGLLYEIHRYRGEAEDAARCAEQLADACERQGNAAAASRYRNQANLVRAGEPLLRVVLDVGGQRHELDEVLEGIEGPVRFLFERNRRSLAPSDALTRRGNAEAGRGRHGEALALYEEAARADPFAPEPVYESARLCLLLGRADEAAEHYDRTEALAPGWFHCRCEGWLARQIAAKRYPAEVYQDLRLAQEGPVEPSIKTQIVGRAMWRFPDLALLHLLSGQLLVQAQQQAGAVAAFRRGLGCAEEPDVRTRLLVDLASAVEGDDERRDLCRQARALGGNLVASATAAVVLAFG